MLPFKGQRLPFGNLRCLRVLKSLARAIRLYSVQSPLWGQEVEVINLENNNHYGGAQRQKNQLPELQGFPEALPSSGSRGCCDDQGPRDPVAPVVVCEALEVAAHGSKVDSGTESHDDIPQGNMARDD